MQLAFQCGQLWFTAVEPLSRSGIVIRRLCMPTGRRKFAISSRFGFLVAKVSQANICSGELSVCRLLPRSSPAGIWYNEHVRLEPQFTEYQHTGMSRERDQSNKSTVLLVWGVGRASLLALAAPGIRSSVLGHPPARCLREGNYDSWGFISFLVWVGSSTIGKVEV